MLSYYSKSFPYSLHSFESYVFHLSFAISLPLWPAGKSLSNRGSGFNLTFLSTRRGREGDGREEEEAAATAEAGKGGIGGRHQETVGWKDNEVGCLVR